MNLLGLGHWFLEKGSTLRWIISSLSLYLRIYIFMHVHICIYLYHYYSLIGAFAILCRYESEHVMLLISWCITSHVLMSMSFISRSSYIHICSYYLISIATRAFSRETYLVTWLFDTRKWSSLYCLVVIEVVCSCQRWECYIGIELGVIFYLVSRIA